MTNSETIEKLNGALTQLIDAYEVLLQKNSSLADEIKQKNENINHLENRLNEANGDTKEQSTKMDLMLNKIQSLNLTKDITTPTKDKLFEDEIDLKIGDDISDDVEDNTQDDEESLIVESKEETSNNNTVDLGRMESLLNGFSK
jgi:hypothetical protein